MKAACKPVLLLLLTAGVVQILAMAAIGHARGSAMAYAYQSPDAAEYVGYARGLAWRSQFVRLDADGVQRVPVPDTWRTPGYPAVLAAWIYAFGDRTCGLLLLHQMLTAATVPLVWLILRRHCRPGWALVGALAWCLDPFRVYYSLWLLAETLFTLVLLIGIYLWSRFAERGWTAGRAAAVGFIAGALVLVRPIALPLPLLACAGVALASVTAGRHQRLRARLVSGLSVAVACALGAAVAVVPWALRNRITAGHWALTSQAGASLAYHKVADVLLWSDDRSEYRFNAEALERVRNEIDRHIRSEWELTRGPLTPEIAEDLRFERLNFGLNQTIDAFAASELLQQIGLELLDAHRGATLGCFAIQGLSMLAFPLGIAVWPPVGTAPLSLLGGGSGLARLVAGGIGLGYAALVLVVLIRGFGAFRCFFRRGPSKEMAAGQGEKGDLEKPVEGADLAGPDCFAARTARIRSAWFAVWPAVALFALSVPSEDPRFRLPLVPLFWLLALQVRRSCAAPPRPLE